MHNFLKMHATALDFYRIILADGVNFAETHLSEWNETEGEGTRGIPDSCLHMRSLNPPRLSIVCIVSSCELYRRRRVCRPTLPSGVLRTGWGGGGSFHAPSDFYFSITFIRRWFLHSLCHSTRDWNFSSVHSYSYCRLHLHRLLLSKCLTIYEGSLVPRFIHGAIVVSHAVKLSCGSLNLATR